MFPQQKLYILELSMIPAYFNIHVLRPSTMRAAARLMEKGIDAPAIIQNTYYEKTYAQNQILGRAMLESILFMDGKCIASYFRQKTLEFYGVTPKDLVGSSSASQHKGCGSCHIYV